MFKRPQQGTVMEVACRSSKVYAGRVTCCRLVTRGEHADGTDRQTDRRQTVTMLFARRGQRNNTTIGVLCDDGQTIVRLRLVHQGYA